MRHQDACVCSVLTLDQPNAALNLLSLPCRSLTCSQPQSHGPMHTSLSSWASPSPTAALHHSNRQTLAQQCVTFASRNHRKSSFRSCFSGKATWRVAWLCVDGDLINCKSPRTMYTKNMCKNWVTTRKELYTVEVRPRESAAETRCKRQQSQGFAVRWHAIASHLSR